MSKMDSLKASYRSDSEDSQSDSEQTFSINEPLPELIKRNREKCNVAGEETCANKQDHDTSIVADQATVQKCLNPKDVFDSSVKESESSNHLQQIFDVKESTTDFFGLSGDGSDDQEEADLTNKTDKIDTVSLGGQKVHVQIPSTSFWSKLDTSKLQNYQVLDSNVSKRKLNSAVKVSHKNKFFRGENYRDQDSEKSNKIFVDDKMHLKDHLNKQTKTNIDKRQLFYIHSKIQPQLHGKNCKRMVPSMPEWTKPAHAGAINRIKWSIPELSHLFVTCSMDSTVKLWNIWTQLDPCLSVIKVHDKAVRDVDWNQDGKQLLSCSYDRTAKLIDIEKGIAVHSLSHKSFVTCGKYCHGQANFCVTGEKDKIQTWDLRAPNMAVATFCFKDSMGQVQDLILSQDQNTLFSCSDLVSRDSSDRNLIAWDFRTGAPLSNQIYQERYTLTRLKSHPKDNTLLAQSYGNYVAIFSMERPYKMFKHKRFEGHEILGYSIGFDITPDGSSVYSGSSDGTIHCYNYQTGKKFKTISTNMDVVMDISCHPVLSSTVAVCGWDGTVQVWK